MQKGHNAVNLVQIHLNSYSMAAGSFTITMMGLYKSAISQSKSLLVFINDLSV